MERATQALPLRAHLCHPSQTHSAGGGIDKFSFFFAFYGLILGLAVAELLGGFAGMVRDRAIKKIEPQTALLALLVFILICATWIDAWDQLKSVSLDFAGLWAPIVLATSYYLAASVVFPRDPAEFGRLGTYFAERKRFIVALLFLSECLVTSTFWQEFATVLDRRPAEFWLWLVPYNLAVKGCMVALFFARGRRTNIILLALLILLFLVPYWEHHIMRDAIGRAWGYPPATP